jgi:hypothetical protein
MKSFIPSKKYDHLFQVEFKSKDKIINDLQLEVYLPDNDKQNITLILRPNAQIYSEVMNIIDFEIDGYNKFPDSAINSRIKVSRAHILGGERSSFLNNDVQFVIYFSAYDLTITYYRANKDIKQETVGYFNIIENFSLCRPKFRVFEPDGSVTVTDTDKFVFTLRNGLEIKFDIHYISKNSSNNLKTSSYPISVAEFTTKFDPEDINKNLIFIDELLILISYAIGARCVCTGWKALGYGKIVTYYRRDINIPKQKISKYYNYIIEPSDLRVFLEKTYPIFTRFELSEVFKNILPPSTRTDKVITETRFLILISVLESIILKYKQTFNCESILSKEDFNKLRTKIQQIIKEHFNQSDRSEERRMMYEKISELNRISFASAFKLFISEYNLNIQDLWPLVDDDNSKTTLISIRNQLIHGVLFNDIQLRSLGIATIHLQLIVDRAILILLKYDIEKTRVSSNYFEHYYGSEIKDIAKYLTVFN